VRADDWTRANTTCFVRTKLLPDVTGRQLPGSPWFRGSMIAGAQSFPVTTRWCLACPAGHARGQRTTHPTRRTHTTARPGPNLAGWRMLWPAGDLVPNLLGAEAAAYAPAARCSMAVASRSTTMRSRGSPETRSLHDRSDCGRPELEPEELSKRLHTPYILYCAVHTVCQQQQDGAGQPRISLKLSVSSMSAHSIRQPCTPYGGYILCYRCCILQMGSD